MSAAMSPPHAAPQRARAFINHSPESYREAIGARAASRGSQRQGLAQPPSALPGRADESPAQMRAGSPLAEARGLPAPAFAAGHPAGNPASNASSVAGTAAGTSVGTSVGSPAGAAAAGIGGQNSILSRRSSEATVNTRPSSPAAAQLPFSPVPARPHSQPALPLALPQAEPFAARTFSSSSGSESGSSQPSESEKRVKEFKDAPRKRRRTSPNELHILETEFARNHKPCKEERERIAATMGMDEKAVQVWFQNKRQSCRRQQNGLGGGGGAARTQSLPMLPASAGSFQDENAAPVLARAPVPPPFTAKPAFAVQTPGAQPAKRAKSLRLAMSADGKAELVERSPLKSLHHNGPAQPQMYFPQFAPVPHMAMRFASMPLSGMETECATSLLFLKSGHWP